MWYTEDFRKRVVAFSDNNTVREAARIFGVAQSQVNVWRKKKKNNEPLTNKPPNRSHLRKVSDIKIDDYLSKHPDAIQREMAKEFGCSVVAVCVCLQKNKFSRKKTEQLRGSRQVGSGRV